MSTVSFPAENLRLAEIYKNAPEIREPKVVEAVSRVVGNILGRDHDYCLRKGPLPRNASALEANTIFLGEKFVEALLHPSKGSQIDKLPQSQAELYEFLKDKSAKDLEGLLQKHGDYTHDEALGVVAHEAGHILEVLKNRRFNRRRVSYIGLVATVFLASCLSLAAKSESEPVRYLALGSIALIVLMSKEIKAHLSLLGREYECYESRKEELRADFHASGNKVYRKGLIRFLKRDLFLDTVSRLLSQKTGKVVENPAKDFLRTHPYSEERISRLIQCGR